MREASNSGRCIVVTHSLVVVDLCSLSLDLLSLEEPCIHPSARVRGGKIHGEERKNSLFGVCVTQKGKRTPTAHKLTQTNWRGQRQKFTNLTIAVMPSPAFAHRFNVIKFNTQRTIAITETTADYVPDGIEPPTPCIPSFTFSSNIQSSPNMENDNNNETREQDYERRSGTETVLPCGDNGDINDKSARNMEPL